MRVLFLVQKKAWFIEHAKAWYRMNDLQQVSLALSGLELSLVNLHDLIEQPHHAGVANVSQTEESNFSISLVSPDEQVLETFVIELDENVLLNIEWSCKPFGDGWLNSEVMLTLDNVRSLHLDTYLPARNGSEGKTLTIANTQTGSSVEVWLARASNNRIPIVEQGSEGRTTLKLTCEPEESDQSNDLRQLGFVVIEQEARSI